MKVSKKREMAEIFGIKIRELRKSLGLTQEELAEKADLNWKMISLIENGFGNMKLNNLIRLSEALNMSFPEMIYYCFDKKPSLDEARELKEILDEVMKNEDKSEITLLLNIAREIKKYKIRKIE